MPGPRCCSSIRSDHAYTDLFLLIVRASLYPVSAMQGLAAVLLTIAAGAGAAAAHVPEFFSFYGHNASAQE